MHTRTRRMVVGVGVPTLAIAGIGLGVAAAGTGDDAEAPISGPALERASAVALDFLGGGRVTDTEVGDEDSYYEVEVTFEDGRQIDLQLDRDFAVVTATDDVAEPGDID